MTYDGWNLEAMTEKADGYGGNMSYSPIYCQADALCTASTRGCRAAR